MWLTLSKKSGPKKILIISLSNVGDVVLTCPVIDILRRDFPQAKIDLVVGPKAISLFEGNPNFSIKVFNKQALLSERFKWFLDLYQEHYDCVIDIRHTMLPVLLWPKFNTRVFVLKAFKGHKKDSHLNRLQQVYHFDIIADEKYAVLSTKADEEFFNQELGVHLNGKSFIVIAPGAAHPAKRWHTQGFAALADYLSAKYQVVFVGDAQDVEIVNDIKKHMSTSALSLAGKTNLRQLAFVLKKSSWAITHDSGVMHLASYFNVPLVVLWGPTSLEHYAPWSKKSEIVRRNEKCLRCLDPKRDVAHNCMSYIEVDDVIKATIKIEQ